MGLGWLLSKDTLHRGGRDTMALCDLSDALATLPVLLDGEVVEYQRSSADSLAFQTGAPHSGAHPLDDQTAFQFCDGSDDDDDGSAQWAAGVDVLPERHELDPDPV